MSAGFIDDLFDKKHRLIALSAQVQGFFPRCKVWLIHHVSVTVKAAMLNCG
jgi:hypothetical protein